MGFDLVNGIVSTRQSESRLGWTTSVMATQRTFDDLAEDAIRIDFDVGRRRHGSEGSRTKESLNTKQFERRMKPKPKRGGEAVVGGGKLWARKLGRPNERTVQRGISESSCRLGDSKEDAY